MIWGDLDANARLNNCLTSGMDHFLSDAVHVSVVPSKQKNENIQNRRQLLSSGLPASSIVGPARGWCQRCCFPPQGVV
jgi:hypothetical protein